MDTLMYSFISKCFYIYSLLLKLYESLKLVYNTIMILLYLIMMIFKDKLNSCYMQKIHNSWSIYLASSLILELGNTIFCSFLLIQFNNTFFAINMSITLKGMIEQKSILSNFYFQCCSTGLY